MTGAVIGLVVLVVMLFAFIFLQVFLSKKENKWLGLILPSLTFIYSLITVFSHDFFTKSTSVVTNSNGEVINETTTITGSDHFLEAMTTIVPMFVMTNIPTLIFLFIYYINRKKFIQREQLNRMTIQDLE